MHKRNGILLALATFVFAADVYAHDTWLLPASMRVPVGRRVRLALTSGEAFPVDDFAIKAERVTRATVRLANSTSKLAQPVPASNSLGFEFTPASEGVAAVSIELAPKVLTLAPNKIEEYFTEINASKQTRALWDSIPQPKQWRESYVKHAASYIRVGASKGDTSWRSAAGMGMELIPEVDPTDIRAGHAIVLRAVRNGRPALGLQVGFQFENDPHVSFEMTDAQGRVRYRLARAGRWLINGTDLRRTRQPNLEWQSDFVTLTIAVAP